MDQPISQRHFKKIVSWSLGGILIFVPLGGFVWYVATRPPIHLEFQGLTRKQDIILCQFFKNWGKDMRSFGANIKMVVNGKENTEYENYVMRDKDKIELSFD